jgi:8-oxo-dGTP pyrophosphatase MutT (NUDIX family)|uniref:Nudix hydrolase domain-containing protein n=1 Tax=viral metagenome TaxID=1070528 RepID=A0A6C0ILM0_9ZZZZ
MPGSAILPATIINGKLYFLFGKENKFEKSAPGFSDFGGGMEKGEKTYEAAIREACEEMTGFLGNEKEVKSLMEKHGTYKVEIENYTSFIFPLQYDPQLIKYYNNNQKYLQRKLPDKVFKTTRIFEKEEIRWIKADDLKKMRHKFRHFYRFMVDLLYNEQKQIKSFIQKGLKNKTKFTRRKRKSVVKNNKSRRNK